MICPVCQRAMIVVEYRDIELDYCTVCSGVWFDSGELELLLESLDKEDRGTFLDNILKSAAAISEEKRRKCPICRRRMKKTTIAEPPGILIDVCPGKHGLWLDGGEVSQLMGHLAGEHPLAKDSGGEIISFLEEVFQTPGESSNNRA